MNYWIILIILILFVHGYVYYAFTNKEGLSKCPDKKRCKEKYMGAFKATGCVADAEPAVLDWWRERQEDSEIWKNMLTRCQKALQPEKNLSKKELLGGQMQCCGAAGCKPEKCILQNTWPVGCKENNLAGSAGACPQNEEGPAPVFRDKVQVQDLEEHPRLYPKLPESIPPIAKKEDAPPIQIPAHKHNTHDPEQNRLIQEIRNTINKMKERMNKDNKQPLKAQLTAEQYGLWKKAVGALKIAKQPKKQPQPISVNVDVTDSRELHYEMPGAPGAVGNVQNLKALLQKMNISQSAKREMNQGLDKMKNGLGKKGDFHKKFDEKIKGVNFSAKKGGINAKFANLERKENKGSYVAYNEDDYGDFEKSKKKVDRKKGGQQK